MSLTLNTCKSQLAPDEPTIYFWDDVVPSTSDFIDGCNVVLHEFAHQLDSLSGSTNGAYPLRRNCYSSWAKVSSSEFEKLKWASLRHHKTTMDEIWCDQPTEFFAVATETF